MKSLQKAFDKIVLLLPYVIVFIYSFYKPADPDLGWHLKYGEYFWKHGMLLRDNTFSTMMADFHWANTSWLTDIIAYSTYHVGGFLGLTILSALVITCTFFFFAKAFSLTLWQQTIIFPVLLYLEEPVNTISFRGQQIVLLFLGVLFYLISLYKKKPKSLWFTIPLFLVWVDIDGEFILGYALFVLWAVLSIVILVWEKVFQQKSYNRQLSKNPIVSAAKIKKAITESKEEIIFLFTVLLGSLFVTFINPFGYGLHFDALSHIGSPLLKDIGEYLPFVYLSQDWWNEVIVGIILIFGLFILGFRGQFLQYLPILCGGLLLFVLSLQIRRYAWPAYYLVLPLLAMLANFLKPDSKKITKFTTSILLFVFLAGVIWMRYPFSDFAKYTWDDYCTIQSDPCSSKSAQYLQAHHLNHNLFSLYGWGGWLIWNYPQIKPTIDGRMHLWVENGYSAFSDYFGIEQNMKDIDKTTYEVVYMTPDKPVYNRLVYLSKIGRWKQVYKDKYSGIFVRLDNGTKQK